MSNVSTEPIETEVFDASTEKAKAIEAIVLAGRMQVTQNGRFVRDCVNAAFKKGINTVDAVKALVSEINQYGQTMMLALEQSTTRFDINGDELERLGIPKYLSRVDYALDHILCRMGSKDIAKSFVEKTKGMSTAHITERLCRD